MNRKFFTVLGLGGLLVVEGCLCHSGMYATDISVKKRDGGMAYFTRVDSLDGFKDYQNAMPVVVDTSSSTKSDEHLGSIVLWLFTLGVFPGFETQTTTCKVAIQTPIGEKVGTCQIEAGTWYGWLPMFLPYPGFAEVRTDSPKLPNKELETKTCDKLVENLVSQFDEKDYDSFVLNFEFEEWKKSDDGVATATVGEFIAKYKNGWRDRAEKKHQLLVEFEEWKKSEDGIATATVDEFVAKFKNGWRDRAEKKREFLEWKKSDDVIANASFEEFVSKYKEGWRERAEKKQQLRIEFEEWKDSEDGIATATVDEFVSKYKEGWRERAQKKRAEEFAEELRLANRGKLFEETVKRDLAKIKECYEKGARYLNPFPGKRRENTNDSEDWLANWSSSRLGISEDAVLAGNAILAEFGMKYLPNAYKNYEKKRDALVEIQQVFNEEFIRPWTITSADSKWIPFNKVLKKFVEMRTEYFICHDELCSYWLLWRFGVLSDKDFASIDGRSLAVDLLPENVEWSYFGKLKLKPLEENVRAFSAKYAPESNIAFQKMSRELKELDALLAEVMKQRLKMDDVRYSRTLSAAVGKRNDLVRKLNMLSDKFKEWSVSHKVMDMSSDVVAKSDVATAKSLKSFIDALPNYISEYALGPIIPRSEFVTRPEFVHHFPGRSYQMQRTEVTQIQWMSVMGDNPSYFRGPDRPVENVSWDDLQTFIKRASQMDGRKYRLPTREEWEIACRAGGSGEYGARMNGECGPLEVMGWFSENSGGRTRSVALLEPNAWGIFDMHGNVAEMCDEGDHMYVCGGSCQEDIHSCEADDAKYANRQHDCSRHEGFRLAVELDSESSK